MEYKQSVKPLSKHWKIDKKQESSYSGGQVAYIPETNLLACLYNGNVTFLSLETGEVSQVLVEESMPESAEEITCFAVIPGGERIITASRNQLIRVWNIKEHSMLNVWRAHNAPISSMAIDSTGTLLLTGSGDHTAKVWDIEKGYCTHNFRHSFGVVHLVTFTKTSKPLYAITCCDDQVIRVWDLYESKERQLIAELKGHLNSVTSLCVTENSLLLSASRDKTVILWNLLSGEQIKTIVVYEAIESIQQVPPSFYNSLGIVPDKRKSVTLESFFFLAGEHGIVHLYRCAAMHEGNQLSYSFEEKQSSSGDNEITFYKREMEPSNERNKAYYASLFVLKGLIVAEPSLSVLGITSSNNFKVYIMADQQIRYDHTIIGNNDEVVDLCYIHDSDHLAVATNSYELRLFSIPTFSSRFLYGHKDTILSVKATPNGSFILTTSKDKTVRLWHTDSHMCLAVCEGHLQDVSCGALSQKPHPLTKNLLNLVYRNALEKDCNHSFDSSKLDEALESILSTDENRCIPEFWVSASEDKTLKLWDLTSISEGNIRGAKVTVKAHDKSINAVCVAPNDKLAATGSMDKTIKLWRLPDLVCVSTLQGHRKGVWDVSFSTINSVLLSSSGDQTIRVWNVKDGSTLYTIEGFDHSLLRSSFLSGNLQVVSCDNAGIIKVNTISSKECVCTIDAHEDKIWALAVPPVKSNQVDSFATGAADGQIKIWKDCTKEVEEQELEMKEQLFLREQEFQQCLQRGDYAKALLIALELDKPYNFRILVEKIMKTNPEYEAQLRDLLKGLSVEDIYKLLSYVREWNLIGRTFIPAQVVLRVIMHVYDFETLLQVKNIEEFIETLLAYNKRHLERTDRLIQNSYLVDYILQNMSLLQIQDETKREEAVGSSETESAKRPRLS